MTGGIGPVATSTVEPFSSTIFLNFLIFESGRRIGVESEVMTVRELADYLKLAEKTAYRLAADGKIPGFKVGASWRFRRSEIDRWIAAQEQGRG